MAKIQKTRRNEYQQSYNDSGPNLVVDGPAAPGSYPSTPDRSLVRTADPRIEDPTIPTPIYKFVDAVDAKPRLARAEEGSGAR